MVQGNLFRLLAARAVGIVSVIVMVLALLASTTGLPETHEADRPVVTAVQLTQVQGSVSCHSQVTCAPFIAPSGANVSISITASKADFALFGKAASNLFGPEFVTPPPRA